MKRTHGFAAALVISIAVLTGGCRKHPAPIPWHQPEPVGAVSPGQFHQIPFGYNPSVSGWPGAVGDIIQNAGSTSAWVRNGTADTAWIVFPQTSIDAGSGGGIVTSAVAPLKIVDGGAIEIADGGIQNPANVVITGGSIVGVNTATRSVQGAMSADDKAFIDDLDLWARTVHDEMIVDVPAVTRCRAFKVPESAGGVALGSTNDGLAEGGGLTANAASMAFGASVHQNTPGGNWSFAFRMVVPAISSGVLSVAGTALVSNASTSIYIGVVGSQDTTHFYAQMNKASAGSINTVLGNWDNHWHDYVVTDDGTTVRYRMDGVLAGSSTTRTNLVAGGMQPFFHSSATGAAVISYYEYCFVAP
jgi:hypothetical protein